MKMTASRIFILFFLFLASAPAALAQNQITFWTAEVERDRLEIQEELADDFAQKTGIRVRVVPVEEDLLTEKVTAAYAARSLPDVLFHPVEFTMGWAEAGILDSRGAAEVVDRLGRRTFHEAPLRLVEFSGGYAAVPVDGWVQLLLYRKDLFQEAQLPAPDRWNHILEGAKALHRPPSMWGIEVATDPGQAYTQQVFEHFALSNGVRMTGPSGEVALNTPEMIETLRFYRSLARFTPPGNVNWLRARLDYLSGRAAMILWSPFILDELSGLRKDQPVLPDLLKRKPGYLARNTGFVTNIQGPGGSARFGQINYLGITREGDRAAAARWVRFLLDEGYLRWLGMAAEGKFPVRKGTPDAPTRFIEGWMQLEFGVTTRAKISDFYGREAARKILSEVEGFDRWGFAEGKGSLISKIYGTKVVAEILKRFLDGELNAGQTARLMEQRIRAFEG